MSTPDDPSHVTASARQRSSVEETVAADGHTQSGDPWRTSGDRVMVELAEGTRIGRYVVLERLGAGAMGVVYAAFDPELDRRVALKLVHAGREENRSDRPDRSDGAARLLREAQAMAKLRHPNVIVVHDVGSFSEQVYIAMEYVDGGTLRRWLEQPRPWQDVLTKFRAAGAGLAAAHSAGIVHRDFKPENVLLGSDGRVCVVDFGLARAVASTAEIETAPAPARVDLDSLGIRLTQTGAVVGTPAYMAPEQHEGTATDARTDQFSFCVALYEALYGQRPFEGDTPASLAFHVLQGDVRAPNDAARVPRWILPIVTRGLAVEPSQRHVSMQALLDALDRDPTAARRRRRAIAGAGVGAMALGGLAWLALAEQPMCEGAEARMTEVWGAVQRDAVQAALIAASAEQGDAAWHDVRAGLDAYAADWVAMHIAACEATHVRGEQSSEMLDRRMACLDRRRRQVQTVVTLLSEADRALVGRAGAVVGKLEPLRECEDAEALLAAPPLDEATRERVQAGWAAIDEVKTLRTAARPGDAQARLDAIADEVALLDHPPLTAYHLYLRGAVALDHGRMKEAEALTYDAAIACAAAKYHGMEAESWIGLVRVIGINGRRFDEVQPLVKAAEAAIARLDDPAYYQGGLNTSVGTVEMLRGNLAEAERRLREGKRLFEDTLGLEHPQTLEAAEMLALTLYSQERYDEAEVAYREILAVHDRVSGPDHPIGASALANLGLVHAARGEHAEALASYEKAHARFLAAWGPEHQVIATSLHNISNTLRRLGRLDEAEEKLAQAIALETELFGPEDTRVASGHHSLGQMAMAREQPERAIDAYGRAVALWEKLDGPTHPQLGFPLTGIGEALLDLGRPSEAVAPLSRALAVRESAEGVPSEELAMTRFLLARALVATGSDRSRALDLARLAHAAMQPERDADAIADIDAWLSANGVSGPAAP